MAGARASGESENSFAVGIFAEENLERVGARGAFAEGCIGGEQRERKGCAKCKDKRRASRDGGRKLPARGRLDIQ